MKFKVVLATAAAMLVSAALVAQTVKIPFYASLDPGNQLYNFNTLIGQVNSYQTHMLYTAGNVASATGTGEQVLGTYSLPGGSLDVVGRHLEIYASFATAANTNTKTPKLYFGSESLATAGITTSAAGAIFRALVTKTGASTQMVSINGVGGAAGVTPVTSVVAGAETDTAGITIKATCTDGTSSAGDCVLADFYVRWMN